jgi:acyl CoA:acetate/3-ketoacid CoA transferase alpha subunit
VIGKHHDKIVASVADALAPLRDGMTILVGGFGLSGNAEALIRGVVDRGVKDLTLVSNNAGNLGKGLAQWLRAGIIRKVICSYIGNNEDLHSRMADKSVDVEITPQARSRSACARRGQGSRRSIRRPASAPSSRTARRRRRSTAAATSWSARCRVTSH